MVFFLFRCIYLQSDGTKNRGVSDKKTVFSEIHPTIWAGVSIPIMKIALFSFNARFGVLLSARQRLQMVFTRF